MTGLCCCTFIRLCTVRRDRRDGQKGGAEALNQDKKEKIKQQRFEHTAAYTQLVFHRLTQIRSHTLFVEQFFSQAPRYKYIF